MFTYCALVKYQMSITVGRAVVASGYVAEHAKL